MVSYTECYHKQAYQVLIDLLGGWTVGHFRLKRFNLLNAIHSTACVLVSSTHEFLLPPLAGCLTFYLLFLCSTITSLSLSQGAFFLLRRCNVICISLIFSRSHECHCSFFLCPSLALCLSGTPVSQGYKWVVVGLALLL